MKNCDIFLIFAQNIDCWYTLELPHRGGSNEYPQSMFYINNKKKNVYPCTPQFYYKKWGERGCSLHGLVFVMYRAFSLILNQTKYYLEKTRRFAFVSLNSVIMVVQGTLCEYSLF